MVDLVYVEFSCGIVHDLSFVAFSSKSPLPSIDRDLGTGYSAESPLPAMATMDVGTPVVSYWDAFSGSGTCSVQLCEGDSVVFSGCEANGGSCFGDTVFHLLDPGGGLVGYGDDECGSCSEVSFISSTAGCSVFTLLQECSGGTQDCGGITAIETTRAPPIPIAITAAAGTPSNCSQQYAALEDLYHSTNGDGWGNNANWLNGDSSFQGWHGIEAACEAGAGCCTVTQLLLNGNNLVGMFGS